MKALLAALGIGSGATALAGDIQVVVHQVEVSHQQMSALLAEDLSDAALFTKLRGMVKAKSATLRDTSMLRFKAGNKAGLESIREIIYPTEYSPDSFGMNTKEQDEQQNELQRVMKLPKEEQRKYWARKILAFSLFPVVPSMSDFETRNVGFTLEVESDEELPVLRWMLDCVSYERDTEIGRTLGLDGKPRIERMPNFDMMRWTAESTVGKGISFAGALTPVAADGSMAMDRKILIFVKADLLK